MCGSGSVLRIEWHPAAVEELIALSEPDQRRIRKVLHELAGIDDARKRLVPYSGNLKGFWKLRCGDFRLVCELTRRGGQVVLIIHLAHRSRVYSKRGTRTIRSRSAG
ncbi:type II toxin-antitoxin system RelE family toxin [Roseitalea porphyridii]|uniref:type II toxin-antitoxin system RelE family toxin n=1 Tax=Roseitalea porphyridii TaxID=1852022 RepID=UPI0009FD4E01